MKKFIMILIIIGSIFLGSPTSVNAQELGQYVPKITISNITSISFTVSWYSDGKADQSVLYGTQEPLDKWATDDRGLGVQRASHHVTVSRLTPETEYMFRINNQGQTFKQKTGPKLRGIAPLPEIFKGHVITEDKTHPEEALIYMKMEGAELLSTYTTSNGSYKFKTVNTRTSDLKNDFRLKETNFVNFFARAGFEGETSKRVFAYARDNDIDLNLQETRIPFYKIKFPDGFTGAPEVVTPDSTPVPTDDPAITASDEGFFGVFWKRVKDIF